MLKAKVIQELRVEAARLRDQAGLIEAFLQGVADEQASTLTSAPDSAAETCITPRLTANGSFASNVRFALRSMDRMASSREVADRLVELGLPDTRNGKPLRNTVAVELFRMSKNRTGGVRKVTRGQYRIETESQEAG